LGTQTAGRAGELRVGMIGGSFDPIHVGHLSIAHEVYERLGLSQMAFVPAGQPPHKLDKRLADVEHRLAMVQLAIADCPHFFLSRIDVDRPGPCYSVDTVRLLQDAYGPESHIYFLVGADSLAELPTWYRPEELLRLCTVVAVGRPGYHVERGAVARLFPDAPPILYLELASPVDVSSTDVRRRVAEGRSIHGLVPGAVERYIDQHGLYRREGSAQGTNSRPCRDGNHPSTGSG
jgi:nicotinate-nucleotide adenylyltransferase